MLLTYSLGLGDFVFGEKRKWLELYIYSRGIWWIFELLGAGVIEKFVNINELDEKSILNFWLGGVVKQEKDRHVIITERSLLFTKRLGLLKCEVSCCLCASQLL